MAETVGGEQNLPSDGRRNKTKILCTEHVPLPQRRRPARGTSIGIHRFGHLCPLQTPARFQCPEPHGIRCLRPAGRTICHTDGTASRNHHRQQYQPLSRAVGQDRFLLRLEPRNPHLRSGILPLDAMGFPKDVQQLLLQLLRIGKTHRPTDRAL